MNFIESFRMSISALRNSPMRTFLTMLGIIIGIFSVITLVAMGEAAKSFVYMEIESMGTGPSYLEIHGGKKGSMAGMVTTKIGYEDAREIENKCPSIKYVDPRIIYPAEFSFGKKIHKVPMVMGNTESMVLISPGFKVRAGRFLSRLDVDMSKKVCVLGSRVVDSLFGSLSPLNETVKINGEKFLVVGIMEEKGAIMGFDMDNIAFLPITTAATLFKIKKIMEIGAVAISEKKVDQAVEEIKQALIRKRGKEDFRIDTMEESMSMLDTIMSVLTAIIGGIAAISLIVGGIGIMNIMLVSVTERFREIGIRKAVGAKGQDIFYQFLTESIIISLMGGLIGIGLGVGLSLLIMKILAIRSVIAFWSIGLAFGMSAMVGIISGVYPAMRAARLSPVEALRYE